MRTLQIRTLESAEGVFPKSGMNNIKFVSNGDGSGVINIDFAIAQPISVGTPVVLTMQGGVIVISGGEELTSLTITNTSVYTVGIKLTSPIGYLSFKQNQYQMREINSSRTSNSPHIDYSEPVYRLNTYINLFLSNPLNTPIDGLLYRTGSVASMANMFNGAVEFNREVKGLVYAGFTGSLAAMFRNAVLFNQDVSSWNVSGIIELDNLFDNALSFNQDISMWNFALNASFNISFLRNTALSPENYSKFLIKLADTDWTGRIAQKTMGAANVRYSAAGAAARASLVASGWTITDGGQA